MLRGGYIRYLAYVYDCWDYGWSESDRMASVTLKGSVLAGKTLRRGKEAFPYSISCG